MLRDRPAFHTAGGGSQTDARERARDLSAGPNRGVGDIGDRVVQRPERCCDRTERGEHAVRHAVVDRLHGRSEDVDERTGEVRRPCDLIRRPWHRNACHGTSLAPRYGTPTACPSPPDRSRGENMLQRPPPATRSVYQRCAQGSLTAGIAAWAVWRSNNSASIRRTLSHFIAPPTRSQRFGALRRPALVANPSRASRTSGALHTLPPGPFASRTTPASRSGAMER